MIHDLFLKLNVIDCNYKTSINEQLGDVLSGWKEGTNAKKKVGYTAVSYRETCKSGPRKITVLLK